jgi:hypothetical protein
MIPALSGELSLFMKQLLMFNIAAISLCIHNPKLSSHKITAVPTP